MSEFNFGQIWDRVREELGRKGIDLDLDSLDIDLNCCEPDGGPFKVFCMTGGLANSIKEMNRTTRDQVLMVRIDGETVDKLDAWLETGAFKSRSEAAALFIREGLKVHNKELEELAEALRGVEDAKEKLRQKAREVFRQESEAEDRESGSSEESSA